MKIRYSVKNRSLSFKNGASAKNSTFSSTIVSLSFTNGSSFVRSGSSSVKIMLVLPFRTFSINILPKM